MSRSTVTLLATSMAALITAAGIARADVVYEWTDAHGEAHYTDQWVPGAKVIRTDTAHRPADSSATQDAQSTGDSASGIIKQQEEAQAVKQDEAKARAQQCTQAKAEYQKLIQSRRIYTTDKSGGRHYLSDADADALRVKAREAMQADCGTGG